MACFQADLASASPRRAADELRTRASEICSKILHKYACRCLFVVSSALASQLKQLICPINTLLAGLQGMPLTLAVALTMCHSSKASSLPRVPIPAYLLTSCRNSGMTGSTCTWATFSSGLTAIARSGGHVISAQRASPTSGRQVF